MIPKAKSIKQKTVKLPQIGVKTGDNFGDSHSTRASSSNIVQELEKKLFSRLEACEQPNKRIKKTKITEMKEINQINKHNSMRADRNLKITSEVGGKIGDRSKQGTLKQDINSISAISNCKKVMNDHDEEIRSFKKIKMTTATQNPKNSIAKDGQFKNAKLAKEEQKQIQLKISENQINRIFNEYLQAEGIEAQTSSDELAKMGEELNECQESINQLVKSFSIMIQQMGADCSLRQ